MTLKSSLCILDNSPLSHVSLTNMFSQSVAPFLILLALSFTEHMLLILVKSSLSVISFMNCAFVMHLIRCLYRRPPRFSPMYIFQVFYSFAFLISICDPLTVNFCSGYRVYVSLYILNVNIQLFLYHLSKKLSLLHFY